jgi:hypothetical protein
VAQYANLRDAPRMRPRFDSAFQRGRTDHDAGVKFDDCPCKWGRLVREWHAGYRSPERELANSQMVIPKTPEAYEAMARLCERDGKLATAEIWRSNAEQIRTGLSEARHANGTQPNLSH